ncbi:conserved hypothetical protein [Theileria orientalis strain Shintoku]|uniref:Uncharacterized protein n=1 Tax=Theileria orientalis strain Shintoku TaxID=869250 RepID=J4D9U5_THEOR|nr:conserved hypothetical protein [Theileria orientalis strain Shintoku]PVC50582.1 hypothetical protein MACL_00002169 [Theileria orientalis]BAM41605.1 conserved hypothetical protein [Theileria orientalis strain Shintoku]|eukprot:XP_009691906.1 conserved hypothetical protein [Theileria orientalis strain Shintoku]
MSIHLLISEQKPTQAAKSVETSEPVSADLTKAYLNNDSTTSTCPCDYTQLNNVGTYISRKGYIFTKVKYSGNSCFFFGSDVVIWESDIPELYAKRSMSLRSTISKYINDSP